MEANAALQLSQTANQDKHTGGHFDIIYHTLRFTAACDWQVRNLHSCIKIAEDFVSPECVRV